MITELSTKFMTVHKSSFRFLLLPVSPPGLNLNSGVLNLII